MKREEIDLAIDWAEKEGWNPGIYDAETFFSADPDGFFIGLLNDEPIATISAVKYGKSFGFLGFYIVKPEYRGKGFGMKIWNKGLKYLDGRNIGLDGVVAQQENYKKSNFKFAYRNIRYQGNGGGKLPDNSSIIQLPKFNFESVNLYDRTCFPEKRREFLKSWINQPYSKSFGILKNNKLAGYGVIRKCNSAYKIGPLFADTPDLAKELFLALKSQIKLTDIFFLDTPEINKAAVDLAETYNMKVVFETARMYTKEKPDISLNKIFGVTSFELG